MKILRDGYLDDRHVAVRENTHVSVEAPASPNFDRWLDIEIDYIGDTSYAGRKGTIDPTYMETIRGSGGSATYGYGTFSASGSNGYPRVSMHAPGADLFVSEVKYRIPGPPGSTWERSTSAGYVLDRSHYIYQSQNTPVTNLNLSASATADIRPKSELTLKPVKCLDGCNLNSHGTATFKNAKRYYMGPRANSPNAELVGVTPVANGSRLR